MKLTTIRSGLAALALCACSQPYAATLISNLPNQVSGTQMSFAQVADNFTLAGAGTYSISSIDFWALQAAPGDYRGSISWTIFNAEPDGSIGTIRWAGVAALALPSAGGVTGFGYTEYAFSIPVAINLTAGDGYWLALHNGGLGDTGDTEMLWETSGSGDAPAGMYKDLTGNSGPDWLDTGNQHAFRIIGERDADPGQNVPEPTTLALLFGALMAAGVVRRQRRAA